MLPYGRQSVDEDDVAAVAAVLRSDWLTTGPAVDAFEADLAGWTGGRRLRRGHLRHGGAAHGVRGGRASGPATRWSPRR